MDENTKELITKLLEQNALILQQLALQREAATLTAPVQAADLVPGNSKHTLVKNLADRMVSFVYDPDSNSTFASWYSRYESLFDDEAATLDDKQKVNLLLQKFSQKDFEKFADTILPKKPAEITINDAVKELKRIFGRKESQFSLRFKCLKLTKSDNEDFISYAARVNKNCERFDVTKCSADDFKVLMFVGGLNSSQDSLTLEKLLSKVDAQYVQLEAAEDPMTIKKLQLQDLVNEAQRLICLKSDKNLVEKAEKVQSEVFAISKPSLSSNSSHSRQGKPRAPSENGNKKEKDPSYPCWNCGEIHWIANCPFKDQQCEKCKGVGHRTGFCVSADRKTKWNKKKTETNQIMSINLIQKQRRKFIEPEVHVMPTVSQKGIELGELKKKRLRRKFIEPNVQLPTLRETVNEFGRKMKFQLDTASDLTIVSESSWKLLGSPTLSPTDEKPISASGELVPIKGCFNCKMQLRGSEGQGSVYVTTMPNLNIFGNDWTEEMNLWDVPFSSICSSVKSKPTSDLAAVVKDKFAELFVETLGRCNKMKASLHLKKGATPVFRKKRPVPFAAAAPLADELKRQQIMGVIIPIKYSEYAAPIVAVRKPNGTIRSCADYSTGLNDSLEPNLHPLPTPDEIFSKLSGMKIFSKIDLSDAFLQIELDDNAKKLMCINTHCGLFQVNRLQPGIKTAPGIFQQLMDTMLSGVEGSFAFLDDIIIGGKDEDSHRKNLFATLARIQDYGFHLKLSKCSFGQPSIVYLGHIIDANGLHPDPEKVKSIQRIPPPRDIGELRAFLGAINWYGKFIKQLKQYRGPLDELLRNDVDFKWEKLQQTSFEKLKTILASDLVLTHYDPNKKIIVAADASSYGMGAVLMHEMLDGSRRPVLHASTSFTAAEKNYPQVQREALALKFAVEKFHRYIYGRKFTLQTDHQPLLSIFGSKTGIPVYTASRLQRYALVLLTYDFDIEYVNTKSFGYVDYISRLIANQQKADEETVIAAVRTNAEPTVCFAVETARSLPITFKEIQQETDKCETLTAVKQFIKHGWPLSQKKIVNVNVAKFFLRRDALIMIENCIFFGDRIIIPVALQPQILAQLHDGHPGTVRMKLLARSKVFWPGIDDDIEELVKRCENCAINAKSPTKCSLQPWPIPRGPWSRIHIDFAGPVNGFSYLVIVDAFTKWPEIFKMTSTTSTKTVDLLDDMMARHGICDVIVSDNGPQLKSEEFEKFCTSNGIEHITTAPYNPQSNGQAERFVDLLKTGLKKMEGEGNVDQKLRKFLMCYRFTPSYSLGMKSPFFLMQNREMKTKLDLLKPKTKAEQGCTVDGVERNEKMKQQFDHHHGAKWKEFELGDEVYFKFYSVNKWIWLPAIITERCGSVNYVVKAETHTGTRDIKVHANQTKKRYSIDSSESNPLMDVFDLPPPLPQVAVEPLLIPDDDNLEESLYEDAESELEDEIPVRRTTRVNAGIPAPRFADSEMSRR